MVDRDDSRASADVTGDGTLAQQPLALQSPLLARAGLVHGFFTRQGGVSSPPYDTLNFSRTTGDDPAAVDENVARAARLLGIAPSRIFVLAQVHGTRVRLVEAHDVAAAVAREQGDATMSRAPGLACGVRVADCAPVLLGDARSGAVAAVHAGWRGVVRAIVPVAVQALHALVGRPLELRAAIGPHIERCCFEVGEDVAALLEGAWPTAVGGAAALVDRGRPKPHVDLRALITAQLRQAGCDPSAIDQVRGCTVCDRARFHSYRRDGARGGRMLAAIVPGPAAE